MDTVIWSVTWFLYRLAFAYLAYVGHHGLLCVSFGLCLLACSIM